MSVGATSFTSSVTGSATRADNDSAKLAEDFDDFLTLLTTQLQHQDPLDPMDSGEFTNQLVAFTGVEQQIQMNQNLETLQTLTALNNAGSVVSMLGQEALIEAPFGDHHGDGVKWQYAVDSDIENITLQVQSENGTTVYEVEGESGLGVHEFNWDGYNTAGNVEAHGNYQLVVEATNGDGDTITVPVAVRETVTAVDTTGISPQFSIGPNTVEQQDILQLFLAQ